MNPLQENNPVPAPKNEEIQQPPPGGADAPACGSAAPPGGGLRACQSYYNVPRHARE